MLWLVPLFAIVLAVSLLFGAWARSTLVRLSEAEGGEPGRRRGVLRGAFVVVSVASLTAALLVVDPHGLDHLAVGGTDALLVALPVMIPSAALAAIGLLTCRARGPRSPVRTGHKAVQGSGPGPVDAGRMEAPTSADPATPVHTHADGAGSDTGPALPDLPVELLPPEGQAADEARAWSATAQAATDPTECSCVPQPDGPGETEDLPEPLFRAFERLLAAQRPGLQGHGTEVLLSVDREVQVAVGRVTLRNILEPVVKQALASAPLGEGLLRISSRKEGEALRLTICDNGPGIATADRQRVFRADEKVLDRMGRRLEHAGAGLVLARQVAERARGCLFIEDAPEGGCAWIVELPLVASPVQRRAPPSPDALDA